MGETGEEDDSNNSAESVRQQNKLVSVQQEYLLYEGCARGCSAEP